MTESTLVVTNWQVGKTYTLKKGEKVFKGLCLTWKWKFPVRDGNTKEIILREGDLYLSGSIVGENHPYHLFQSMINKYGWELHED